MTELEYYPNCIGNRDIGIFPVPYHLKGYKYKEVSKWRGERGEGRGLFIKIEFGITAFLKFISEITAILKFISQITAI